MASPAASPSPDALDEPWVIEECGTDQAFKSPRSQPGQAQDSDPVPLGSLGDPSSGPAKPQKKKSQREPYDYDDFQSRPRQPHASAASSSGHGAHPQPNYLQGMAVGGLDPGTVPDVTPARRPFTDWSDDEDVPMLPAPEGRATIMSKPEGAPDYDGAGGQSYAEVKGIHQCRHCSYSYVMISHFAYVTQQPGSPFYMPTNPSVHRAVAEAAGAEAASSNIFRGDAPPIKMVCWQCAEMMHDAKYMKEDGKFTSVWMDRSKYSRGAKFGSAKIKHIASRLETRMEEQGVPAPISMQDVIQKWEESPLTRATTDWCPQLVPDFVSLLYGCSNCNIYPTKSNYWWRTVPRGQGDRPGGMDTKKGQWRCPCCCRKWEWRNEGTKQLLIMGDAQADVGYMMCHIGKLSTRMEGKLELIKRCQMMTYMRTNFGIVPITKELILKTLDGINERTTRHLLQFKETSKDTAKSPTMLQWDVDIYCEDPRLSLAIGGTEIFVIRPNESDNFVSLSEQEIDQIFDMCCGFLNLEDVPAKSSNFKNIKWDIMHGQPFRTVRQMMQDLSLAISRGAAAA